MIIVVVGDCLRCDPSTPGRAVVAASTLGVIGGVACRWLNARPDVEYGERPPRVADALPEFGIVLIGHCHDYAICPVAESDVRYSLSVEFVAPQRIDLVKGALQFAVAEGRVFED